MILVDKDIRRLASEGKLISENFAPENVGPVSVDLTVLGTVNDEGKLVEEFNLDPNCIAIVKTREKLAIPHNMVGRVGEKNSVIRTGIKVDAPLYQPGHCTYAFLRVINLTGETFTVRKGFHIAQIFFEEIKGCPEVSYNEQPGASFNEEDDYVGYGKYSRLYRSLLKKYEKSEKDLDDMKGSIYANVLTLMGIMVAVFSMVTVNCQALFHDSIQKSSIVVVNLSLLLCIIVMLGSIVFIINNHRKKKFAWAYGIIVAALAIATFLAAFLF